MNTARHLQLVPPLADNQLVDRRRTATETVTEVTDVVRQVFARRRFPLTILDLLEPRGPVIRHLRAV